MLNLLRYSLRKSFAIFAGSPVEKGCIPAGFLLFIFSQYFIWCYYALTRPDRDRLINVVYVNRLLLIYSAFALGAALLLGFGLWLRKRAPNSIFYQHLTANYYGVTLVFGGYMSGALSFAAGIVLLGATLMGSLLLERRVVMPAFGIAFVTLFGFNLASAFGYLPYAPALVAPTDSASALFWTHSAFFFAAPNILTIVTAMAVMVMQWREREAAILELSLTDPLTHVHNRRSILQLLEQEMARTERYGVPLSLVMVDLDHFKQVNDTWGHLMGDRVLQAAADALRSTVRECDVLGRFGGEEFLLLFPNTRTEEALGLVERCRQQLAALDVCTENGVRVPVSASFGVVCNEFTLEVESDILLRVVDDALYRAKQAGRNRAELAPPSAVWALKKQEAQLPALSHARQSVKARKGNQRIEHEPVSWSLAVLNKASGAEQNGISKLAAWQQRIAAVLEWSPVAKSNMVTAWIIAALFGYCMWLYFLPLVPESNEFFNLNVVAFLQTVNFVLLMAGSILFAVGLKLRPHLPNSKLFQYASLQFYSIAMLAINYACGILYMPAGLMIISSPLLGLILFEQSVVLWSFGICLFAIIVLAYLSALGIIPYAPLLAASVSRYDVHTPFWMFSNYLFLLIILAVVLTLADHVLKQRREREAHIQRLSRTDALTNVHNRRSIMNLLAKEVARTLRHGPPLAVVLLDLDHFKRINDTWGHSVGDKVLREAASVLSQTIRQCDAVGRYGGEEFLLLLADTTLEGAKALVERCRIILAETQITTASDERFSFSASFGIASNEQCFELSASSLIKAADEALYRAKEGGRNRVEAVAVSG